MSRTSPWTARCSPWILALILICLGVLRPTDASLARKALEKELLHQSIRYLREQLLVCLKATDSVRGKRKADVDASRWMAELELQMDIDILQNTRSYLFNRVLQCRRRSSGSTTIARAGKPDPAYHMGAILKSKMDTYLPTPGEKLQDDPFRDLGAPTKLRATPLKAEVAMAVAAEVEVTTSAVQSTTTVSTTTTTATTTTESSPSLNKQQFILDGRQVTCNSFSVLGSAFQCLDLRVNETERLPNKDFCPPTYEAERWRPVSDMSSRTRDVLDLLNLCAIFGQTLVVPGYSKDVRVVWACDDIKPRLKWQNGGWSGYVEDNGYLHDLMCVYSADISWPRRH